MTPKQEAFCLAYIETGNASEAYRRAYNAENMKPETVNNKGYELLQKGEIRARLAELREPILERHGDTVRSEEHTSELQSLMRISYAVFCLKKKTNNKITTQVPT